MKNLYFDDIEDLACSVADKFDELDTEEFEDISVIAKYDEVKEVFKELVCIGYDICSITLDMPDRYGYNDEYILGLSNDGLWIEKFKRENGYFEDESTIIYILDNCSSKVIPYCKGKTIYEVAVGDNECEDEGYTVNGKPATKEEFDVYVSQFKSDGRPSNKDIHIEADGDMHGFSVNHSGENGWSSYSFYSTDMDLVNGMAKMFR